MRFRRRAVTIALAAAWTGAVQAGQPPAGGALSAEQILERSIEAAGGREAYAKLTSTMAKGVMEFSEQHLHGVIEFYAKAPNKRLVVTNIENLGEFRQGFDGQTAWMDNPLGGLRRLEGAEAARIRLEADFHRPLKWPELYSKIELAGKETVAGRPAYVVRLTPKEGRPVTHYYDAENFLLLRQDMVQETSQGEIAVQAVMSDYRDVGGVKTPHRIEQRLPMGKIVIQFSEIRNNVELDDARFAMPPAGKP